MGDESSDVTALLADRPHDEGAARRALDAARRELIDGARGALGRYILGERLGAGGLGVVHRARDPDLERDVAIKLIHPRTRSFDLEAARKRFLREGRVLARLSHPNIVEIYDWGASGDTLYVVMELVEGPTLAQWIDQYRRRVDEVLAMLVQAGRGLAAAHADGIVHRDFKLSNVMVAADGRARVLDFGLARVLDGESVPGDAVEASPDSAVDLSTSVTQTEEVVGTPTYMAPEQHLGGGGTAASDQFAFCVALWRALAGELPYRAATRHALLEAKRDGAVEPAPPDRIPVWLQSVLRRGLAPRPEDRWPSMVALLDQLAGGGRRHRIRALLLGAAAVGVAGAGVHLAAKAREKAACVAEADAVSEVWNAAVRDEIAHAFADTDVPYAADTWDRAAPHLDAYATRWADARRDLCTMPEVDSRARACLDHQRARLEALVRELTEPAGATVERTVEASLELPAATDCSGEGAPMEPTVPEALRADVEQVQRELADASGSLAAARPQAAIEGIRTAVARAEAVGWAPLTLDALLLHADALGRLGDDEAARTAGEAAYALAAETGADRKALRAATALAHIVGRSLSRHDEGLDWVRTATTLVERLSLTGQPADADVLAATGALHVDRGALTEALDAFRRSLSIREATLGRDHPTTVDTIGDVGVTLYHAGDYAGARPLLEEALQRRQAVFGPDHPRVAEAHANLGNLLRAMGEPAAAREQYEHALVVAEQALGPDNPTVATMHGNLGTALFQLDDHDGAGREFSAAVAALEASVGPEHLHVAAFRSNLGLVLAARGDFVGAEREHRTALAIREAALGLRNAEVAISHHNLAGALRGQERFAEARRHYESALEMWTEALGPDHPNTRQARTALTELPSP